MDANELSRKIKYSLVAQFCVSAEGNYGMRVQEYVATEGKVAEGWAASLCEVGGRFTTFNAIISSSLNWQVLWPPPLSLSWGTWRPALYLQHARHWRWPHPRGRA